MLKIATGNVGKRSLTATAAIFGFVLFGCQSNDSTESPQATNPAQSVEAPYTKKFILFNNNEVVSINLVYAFRSNGKDDTVYHDTIPPQKASDTLIYNSQKDNRLYSRQTNYGTPSNPFYGEGCFTVSGSETEDFGKFQLWKSDPNPLLIYAPKNSCDVIICDSTEDCSAITAKLKGAK